MMAWVMAGATGRSFARLLHERLWAPLGCEEDGYAIADAAGVPICGAGLSASLRDLARFGDLMRREGDWDGKQVTSDVGRARRAKWCECRPLAAANGG